MFRFFLNIAACISTFWLIGNLAIKLFGFAPEWSWWFTLMPLCATIPVSFLIKRVQRYDATLAHRDFMKSFDSREYQATDRVQRHEESRG